MPPAPLPSASGKYAIELDGVRVGAATWVAGGEPVGDVVGITLDPSGLIKKHITKIKWEPITVSVGIGMARALLDWISDFAKRGTTVKNGAIIFFDAAGQARSRLEWQNGRIIELRFPGADATDRSQGQIVVTIQPERTVTRTKLQEAPLVAAPKQPPWILGNFRVAIDRITGDTRRVSKVEAITLRRKTTELRDGGSRHVTILLGPLEVSDLILSLPEGQSNEFAQWAEDFLVQGHSSDTDERNGALEYLTPSMAPLFNLTFKHVGIMRLARERLDTSGETIARVKAHLYCEEVLFTPPAGIAQAPARRAGRAAKKAAPKKVAKRPVRRR